MQRLGRRYGFFIGVALGAIGAVVAVVAILTRDFGVITSYSIHYTKLYDIPLTL